uniref:Uncharacterized protein n=1 Tax=Physcomitrium patens TaxID=3218 RepID=A0A2K1KP33_PHYPA|nr:hypothetical protein PHYPA_006436 [Physcomitrium patens]
MTNKMKISGTHGNAQSANIKKKTLTQQISQLERRRRTPNTELTSKRSDRSNEFRWLKYAKKRNQQNHNSRRRIKTPGAVTSQEFQTN